MKTLIPLSALLFASTGLAACASTDLGQREVGEGPRTGETFSETLVLRRQYGAAEAKLRDDPSRITDPRLQGYLGNLAADLAGEYGDEVRVYVLEAPVFNAFVLPNGAMGVNSGLLLRAETEDELALVLGHEFGHYYERHAEEGAAAGKRTGDMVNVMRGVGAGAGGMVGLGAIGASLGMVANSYSFGRDQELEADDVGVERARAEGYDPAIGIRLWQNLDEEKAASSISGKRKNSRRAGVFDSHPTSTARLERLKTSVGVQGALPEPTRQAKAAYRARIRPWLGRWISAEIAAGDAGSTLALIDRLDDLGEDLGVLRYARAYTIDRARRDPKLADDKPTQALLAGESDATVIATLREAVQYPDAPALAHRALGNLLYKSGDTAGGIAAFRDYLRADPNAGDADQVQAIIDKG